MAIMKCLVRTAVIMGLVGGAAVAIAGPDRVGALIHQARARINGQIDKHIEDPIALRSQLRSLAAQYPARIAEIRGDLAELKQQTAQLERDMVVQQGVIELTDADLGSLRDLIARAESARTGSAALASAGSGASMAAPIVRVVFNNEPMNIDQAYARATWIQQAHAAAVQRVCDIERDLGYMQQQDARLSQLLTQLEGEQTSFHAQLAQLDGQVDAIARNERLIETLSERQETIERHSRYRAASLDQLQARLADIRARQDSQLESLSRSMQGTTYEQRARIRLDAQAAPGRAEPILRSFKPERPKVIEIRPEDPAPAPVGTPTKPA